MHKLLGKYSKLRPVVVPEWDTTVYVGIMTGTQRDQMEISRRVGTAPNFRAQIVQLCSHDSNGDKLFSETDLPDLGNEPCSILDRIVETALVVNLMNQQEIDDLKKKLDQMGGQDGSLPLPDTTIAPDQNS